MEYLNEVFGRLTPIEFLGAIDGNNCWLCACECGNSKIVRQTHLKYRQVLSCGCMWHEDKHGMSDDRVYNIYKQMKQRCYNPNHPSFNEYGGRGIKICERWLESFESFWEDMEDGYSETLTLDRIDVNGGYYKENCRWVTKSIQGFNQRKRSTNSSGKTGVSFSKRSNKWRAYITFEGKSIHLGVYQDFEAAVKARENAELEYFGTIKE